MDKSDFCESDVGASLYTSTGWNLGQTNYIICDDVRHIDRCKE